MTEISDKAQKFLAYEFKMEEYFKKVAANSYHKDLNPDGVIDMGTSTNAIVSDLIMEKLKEVNIAEMPLEYFHTCKVAGPQRFRKAAAEFFNRYMQPKFTIESDDIFVMAGAGACFESLGFSLINPGDVILVPRPYYYQFDHEFHRVSGAELVTFPVCVIEANTGTRCFIKKEDLQLAYDQAASSGAVVKALLIVSPNNPIGYVLEEEVLQVCLDFIKEHNLQLISDEIYMNCIFGEPKFQSVLNIVRSCDDLDNIHITWAFSKDFAVAGFRVGVTITKNEKIKAIFKENLNRRVSNFTLYALEGLITDFNWLNTVYFPEFKKRLAEKTYFITKSLENLGVHVVHCNAGLYVWANFEKYLYSRESKRADELFHCFLKQGIYIAPGKAFGETNPGWFRLITSLEQDRLDKGIKRITEALKIYSHK